MLQKSKGSTGGEGRGGEERGEGREERIFEVREKVAVGSVPNDFSILVKFN